MKKSGLVFLAVLVCGAAQGKELKIILPSADSGCGESPEYALDSAGWGERYARNSIFIRAEPDGKTVVHRRIDNGTAGSGRVYPIIISKSQEGASEAITYSIAGEPRQYQQGLIGKFPVPEFNENDVFEYFGKGSVHCAFDVNSEFSPDSIGGNFERLPRLNRRGENEAMAKIMNKEVWYSYKVFPYRNGSKAQIGVSLPAIETSPGVIDFNKILQALKSEVNRVVGS